MRFGYRSLALAAVVITAVRSVPLGAQTQDLTTYTRNGTATISGSTLILTPAVNSSAGSAFNPTPLPTAGLQSLTAIFNYTMSGGTGADGIAFILQGNNANALGVAGGSLGYETINNSVAALFRSYVYNVVQVGTEGAINGNQTSATVRGTHDVTVSYITATQLFSIVLDGTTTVQQTVNLASLVGPMAYVGFSAGTGALNDQQQINRFSLAAVYAQSTVPEPSALALLGTGLAGMAGFAIRRLRRGKV